MKKAYAICIVLAALCCQRNVFATPDEYILQIKPDKKVLYVSRLNIDNTVSIKEVLDMFPEFLVREGEGELKNYDVQIKDVSTGRSKTAILKDLRVADVEKIEISQSSNSSQQTNGQGGVINIFLNPLPEGFSGSSMVSASTMWDAMPTVRLNYRKGALSVLGSVMMEYNQPRNNNTIHIEDAPDRYYSQVDTNTLRNGYETARISLLYKPNDKHDLQVWAWESYERDRLDKMITFFNSEDGRSYLQQANSNSLRGKFNLYTGADYKFTYGKGYLKGVLQYEYSPNDVDYDKYNNSLFGGLRNYTTTNQSTNALKMEFRHGYHFIPVAPNHKCEFKVGLNYHFLPSQYSYLIRSEGGSIPQPYVESFLANTVSNYVSPYMELDGEFGKFSLNAAVRYQYYKYDIKAEAARQIQASTTERHDVTGFVKFGWQVVPHHHLRLIFDRSVLRPDNQQVFPYLTYEIENDRFVMGNEDLMPKQLHTLELNYIYDFSKGPHDLVFNTSLQYINTSRLFNAERSVDPGKYVEYYTYTNDGVSNIIAWNTQLMYSFDIFSMALSANLFNNYECIGGINNKYFCYNISFAPMLHLPYKWGISAKIVYNSKIEKIDRTLGDYFYSQVRLSKVWKDWTFFAEWDDNFHKQLIDTRWSGSAKITDSYNIYRPCFTLGFYVTFGR